MTDHLHWRDLSIILKGLAAGGFSHGIAGIWSDLFDRSYIIDRVSRYPVPCDPETKQRWLSLSAELDQGDARARDSLKAVSDWLLARRENTDADRRLDALGAQHALLLIFSHCVQVVSESPPEDRVRLTGSIRALLGDDEMIRRQFTPAG